MSSPHECEEVIQLRRALATRGRVGTAVGIVMERFGLDEDVALSYLQRASQHTNRKLVVIADEIRQSRVVPTIPVPRRFAHLDPDAAPDLPDDA